MLVSFAVITKRKPTAEAEGFLGLGWVWVNEWLQLGAAVGAVVRDPVLLTATLGAQL